MSRDDKLILAASGITLAAIAGAVLALDSWAAIVDVLSAAKPGIAVAAAGIGVLLGFEACDRLKKRGLGRRRSK